MPAEKCEFSAFGHIVKETPMERCCVKRSIRLPTTPSVVSRTLHFEDCREGSSRKAERVSVIVGCHEMCGRGGRGQILYRLSTLPVGWCMVTFAAFVNRMGDEQQLPCRGNPRKLVGFITKGDLTRFARTLQ